MYMPITGHKLRRYKIAAKDPNGSPTLSSAWLKDKRCKSAEMPRQHTRDVVERHVQEAIEGRHPTRQVLSVTQGPKGARETQQHRCARTAGTQPRIGPRALPTAVPR